MEPKSNGRDFPRTGEKKGHLLNWERAEIKRKRLLVLCVFPRKQRILVLSTSKKNKNKVKEIKNWDHLKKLKKKRKRK